jgi:DNA-binding response OmpR family regulator
MSGRPERAATVLVIEDSPTEQAIIGDCLRAAGFTVITLGDGIGVSAYLREHPTDLLLLDVILPRTSGFAVCREVRNDPRSRDIPIVMLTQRTTAPDEFYGRHVGADRYIKKPVRCQTLVDEVSRLLERRA